MLKNSNKSRARFDVRIGTSQHLQQQRGVEDDGTKIAVAVCNSIGTVTIINIHGVVELRRRLVDSSSASISMTVVYAPKIADRSGLGSFWKILFL